MKSLHFLITASLKTKNIKKNFVRMVNTFVVSTDLKECAESLDNLRLNKQIQEANQIVRVLEAYDETGQWPSDKGYSSHPIVKMWLGYTNPLKIYINHMLREWRDVRGKNHKGQFYDIDESQYRIVECEFDGEKTTFAEDFDEYTFPPWFSFPPLILSHRASLIRKDPKFYDFLLDEQSQPYVDRGYFWPCKFSDDEYFNEWKFEYLAPIGAGAPSQYRYTREDAMKWSQNKTKNPKTGRAIKENGPLYRDLEKAYEHYVSQEGDL